MDIQDKLENAFAQELIRKLVVKYFHQKGFGENFDEKVYPPLISDIGESIPELAGRLEVEPFAAEVDPTTGQARLGWNLFVLGSQRMYLGETQHAELSNLAKQLENTDSHMPGEIDEYAPARFTRTARDIVNFIVRALRHKEAGIAGIATGISGKEPQKPSHLGHIQHTDWFNRPKSIRPEGSSQF